MGNFYFKLVCIDEFDPFGYHVLQDVNLGNLDDVHEYIVTHIKECSPNRTKWILIPIEKNKAA